MSTFPCCNEVILHLFESQEDGHNRKTALLTWWIGYPLVFSPSPRKKVILPPCDFTRPHHPKLMTFSAHHRYIIRVAFLDLSFRPAVWCPLLTLCTAEQSQDVSTALILGLRVIFVTFAATYLRVASCLH